MQPQQPVDNVTYDVITTLQSKLEGLNAYKQYIRDCQQSNNTQCAQLFQQLQQQDTQQVQQLRQAMTQMLQGHD
jgi:hypothetical protein